MKQTLLLIVTAVFVTTLRAQSPTLTSTINYNIGDQQITLTADTTGIEPGPAGINQTWDFSKLKRDSAMDSTIVTYLDPKKTLYSGDFKTATVAGEISSKGVAVYTFYDMTNAVVENLGDVVYDSASTSSDLTKFTNAFTLFKYPLQYGDTFSSRYMAPPSGNNAGYTIGTYTVKADAYGSMKIRNTQYDSVLRLYVTNFEADSVYAPGIGSFELLDDSSHSYIYYSPGKKSPILTISLTTASKTVIFNDFDHVRLTGIAPEKNESISFSLFPNPAKNTAKVSMNLNQSSYGNINIVDELGQVVQSLENIPLMQGANNFSLDLQGIPHGIYFVTLISNGQMGRQKLVVD